MLISACLLGINCRYDGKGNWIKEVERLKEKFNLIPVCPEIYGGMMTPRMPAERKGDRVVDSEGNDVTAYFVKGAQEMLRLAEFYSCKYAILKERSPSCGHGKIYDGTFTKTLVDGEGILAQMLINHGIQVIGESQIGEMYGV